MKELWKSLTDVFTCLAIWILLLALFPSLTTFVHQGVWHFVGAWTGYWILYCRYFKEDE